MLFERHGPICVLPMIRVQVCKNIEHLQGRTFPNFKHQDFMQILYPKVWYLLVQYFYKDTHPITVVDMQYNAINPVSNDREIMWVQTMR